MIEAGGRRQVSKQVGGGVCSVSFVSLPSRPYEAHGPSPAGLTASLPLLKPL